MNKFEKLVDLIINEEQEQAKELFHEIVVEKSREIYNQIVREEYNEADASDDFMSDIEGDEEGLDMSMPDATSDLEDEMGVDMDGSMDMGDEDIEDRVVDLESALDELKAEFDSMMADKDMDGDIDGHEHDMDDEDMDMDMDDEDMDMDDEDMDMDDEEEEELKDSFVREYVEKVASPKGEDYKAVSPVAKKNDMGGSAKNLVAGGSNSNPDGTGAPKSPKVADMNTGNRNVPGGSANKLERAPAPKKAD